CFQFLFVYQQTVFNFQTQTGDAVVNACNVSSAANTFQNSFCHCCVVVCAQFNIHFSSSIVIFTTWSLQVEFNDHDAEYNIVDYKEYQTDWNQQDWVHCEWSLEGQEPVNKTSTELETSTNWQGSYDCNGDTGQNCMSYIQSWSQEHE